MNCRKSVPELEDKNETMKLLTQVAADTAWNHDLVSHCPYPQQTKKPHRAFALCVVLKETVT